MVSVDKRRKNHDDTDDWCYGGVQKRDFQQSKDGPEVTGPARKRKRDPFVCHRTKRVHVTKDAAKYGIESIRIQKCVDCGKEFWGERQEAKLRKRQEEQND